MPAPKKVLPADFYKTAGGNIPVRAWLLGLDKEDRQTIGEDIASVECGWPVGMPTVRPLGDGLWEVRSNISDSRISRVLFCVHAKKMVLLHGFIKKTQSTPKADKDLALKRKKEL